MDRGDCRTALATPGLLNSEHHNILFLTDLVYPGLFYKHLCTSLIHQVSLSSFVKIFSKHCLSQIVWARDLTCWENIHPNHVSHVTFLTSHFKCHMTNVTFNISIVKYFYSFIGQSVGANWWRVCHHWSLLRFVFTSSQGGLCYIIVSELTDLNKVTIIEIQHS